MTIPVHQPERNYPRRERDEDEEPRRAGSGKRGVLVGAVTVAAVAVVIVRSRPSSAPLLLRWWTSIRCRICIT